jgi:uncharacterized membrane protein YedE/YeeE
MTRYLALGVFFGIVLVKAEIVSWWRIQEMFRFDSLHMYGVMGSAVLTAFLGLRLIRGLSLRTTSGEPIEIPGKELGTGTRYWAGGTTFGVGWALSGGCPGPLVAIIGAGVPSFLVAFAAALGGTYAYALVRHRLPH